MLIVTYYAQKLKGIQLGIIARQALYIYYQSKGYNLVNLLVSLYKHMLRIYYIATYSLLVKLSANKLL